MALQRKFSAKGFKDVGTGIVLIGGAILAFYLIKKLIEASGAIASAAKPVVDFVQYATGNSDTSSPGTDFYNMLHPNQGVPTINEAQAIKSCNIAWARNGKVQGVICQTLYAQGKLTQPPITESQDDNF